MDIRSLQAMTKTYAGRVGEDMRPVFEADVGKILEPVERFSSASEALEQDTQLSPEGREAKREPLRQAAVAALDEAEAVVAEARRRAEGVVRAAVAGAVGASNLEPGAHVLLVGVEMEVVAISGDEVELKRPDRGGRVTVKGDDRHKILALPARRLSERQAEEARGRALALPPSQRAAVYLGAIAAGNLALADAFENDVFGGTDVALLTGEVLGQGRRARLERSPLAAEARAAQEHAQALGAILESARQVVSGEPAWRLEAQRKRDVALAATS